MFIPYYIPDMQCLFPIVNPITLQARADHTSSDEDKLKELVVEDKNRVLDALIRSVADIPLQIRSVVQHMVAEIEGRWPNDPSSKSAVIL